MTHGVLDDAFEENRLSLCMWVLHRVADKVYDSASVSVKLQTQRVASRDEVIYYVNFSEVQDMVLKSMSMSKLIHDCRRCKTKENTMQ